MPADKTDRRMIEVFKSGGYSVERRRTILAPARTVQIEKSPDLVALWRILWKRRWIVLTAFTALFSIVLVGTLKQTPMYRSKALIEIERENPSLVNPQELFQIDEVSDAYLETQYKVLASQDLAERVIERLRLDRLAEFCPPSRSWSWLRHVNPVSSVSAASESAAPVAPAAREIALAYFQKRLEVKPIRRSRAVEITFDSQNPDLAASVVNALSDEYIQKNLESRWDATQKASEWFSQQLTDVKAKLERSEAALQSYASENGLVYLQAGKENSESMISQSMRELQEELMQVQAARYEKESLYRLVQSGDYGSLPGVFDNRLMQDLSVRLAELQRERAQLDATFTDDYPRVKQIQSQIEELQSALDRERKRAAEKISNDYLAAVKRETLVREAFAEKQRQADSIAEKSVQYGMLSREVDSNKSMYDGLLQRLKEAGVSAGLKASNIRIVDRGEASYTPVSPSFPVNLGLAAILGLGLGVSFAYLREQLDQSIQTSEDVHSILHTAALGSIPSIRSLKAPAQARVSWLGGGSSLRVTIPRPRPVNALVIAGTRDEGVREGGRNLSESFRAIRTSVLLSNHSRAVNSILVTSAQSGEGKTTVAVNLAISLAQLGRRVLLVDADMRHASVQKYFPQRGSWLSNYLDGHGMWADMVYPTTVHGLHVLLSGPRPANPSELLSSDAMHALVREASTAYSFVIIDSPPLLDVVDSRILANMVDATVLVVKSGDTPRQVVQYADLQARSAGANVIGVVLNQAGNGARKYSHFDYREPDVLPVQS